jgi:hypothetical protein
MAMKAKRKASRAPYRLATAGKEGILFLPGFIIITEKRWRRCQHDERFVWRLSDI